MMAPAAQPILDAPAWEENHTTPTTEQVWARMRALSVYLERATTSDHPSDIFDAGFELSQLVQQIAPDKEAAAS